MDAAGPRAPRESSRWYDGLPAATAEIDCGGQGHRITWRDGALVLEDHDTLAEESLMALGAKPPMCLQVLDAWRRATRDSQLLSRLLIGDSRQAPALFDVMKRAHETRMDRVQEMTDRPAERREREQRRWAVALVNALPPGLRQMLVLSVLVNVERRWAEEEFRQENAKHVEPVLTAIAAPLFAQSAHRWRRYSYPSPRFTTEAWLQAPGEAPKCSARADGRGAHAALALPVSWLREVWARGIVLVDDGFVTGLTQTLDDGSTLLVLATHWERENWESAKWVQAPALLTQGRRGEWRLRWS